MAKPDEKRAGIKGGPDPGEPRPIGDDDAAGYHAGEDFLPRKTDGDVREVAVEPSDAERTGSVPYEDTDWEKRVARGEESLPEGEAKRDINDEVFPQQPHRPRR